MITNNLTAEEISAMKAENIDWGSCYTAIFSDNTINISCHISQKETCSSDIFISKTECSAINLSSIVKDNNGNWYATNMSESVFASVSPGSHIQNLVYAGIYTPSSLPIFTGSTNHTSTDSSKYAILIYPKLQSYSFSKHLPLNNQTSLYSGIYNKVFGNRIQSTLNEENQEPEEKSKKTWLDFYIPSFGELIWLKKQMKSHFSLKNTIHTMMTNTNSVLVSSTVFFESAVLYPKTKEYNRKYMRGISIFQADNKYYLVNPNNRLNLIHFRAIPLI